MVEALAFALEEAADRRVGTSGFEELDFALADCEERGFDALVFDRVLRVKVEAESIAIELQRFVQRADGDADVVDLVDHGFVPRVSSAPKWERRDSSRLEYMLSMPAKGVVRHARIGLPELRMIRFISPLSDARR